MVNTSDMVLGETLREHVQIKHIIGGHTGSHSSHKAFDFYMIVLATSSGKPPVVHSIAMVTSGIVQPVSKEVTALYWP